MLESLTVMGVDSEDSRERRAPWGVLKFLKAREKCKPRAVSFEIDKLMIWAPAPSAIDIIKNKLFLLQWHRFSSDPCRLKQRLGYPCFARTRRVCWG